MLRKVPRFATWALIAFVFVCVLALAGCKPMVFAGEPQSRKVQIGIGACAVCFILLGLVQIPLAIGDNRREKELQEYKRRRRLEQLSHGR